MEVGLISCAKTSKNYPCKVEEMYIDSALFRAALEYSKRNYNGTYVLSTKHGLLKLDTIIEPYDESLTKKSQGEQIAWSDRVVGQIFVEFGEWFNEHWYYFHTGVAFRKHLKFSLRHTFWPVGEMRIGERLKFYKDSK